LQSREKPFTVKQKEVTRDWNYEPSRPPTRLPVSELMAWTPSVVT